MAQLPGITSRQVISSKQSIKKLVLYTDIGVINQVDNSEITQSFGFHMR